MGNVEKQYLHTLETNGMRLEILGGVGGLGP
jgi:hypothetical protein